MKKLLAIAAILSLATAYQIQAQVQSSVALSVSPPHSEIMVKPGKNIVQAFNIQNIGSVDLVVTPTLVDFVADKETGQQRILSTSSFPYAELQNLDKKLGQEFTLQAGQKDQLVVKFTIPENAPDHDYYQTLLLSTKPLQLLEATGTSSQAFANVGINILVRVSDTGVDNGNVMVERVKIPKIIDVFSPINMQIFVKNTGKNYTTAKGEVRVVSALTQKVDKVFPILEENVLQDSVRQIHTSIPDPDDSKSATAGEFTYDPLFLIGPYTVEIALGKDQQAAQTYHGRVWALPISPLILITLFLVARFFLKKLNRVKDIPLLDP